MSDRILLNPDNRWLGSSSSNDFSLYGAQPDPAVSLRVAESNPRTDEADPAAASAASAADRSPASDPAREPDAAPEQPDQPSSVPQVPAPPAPLSGAESAFVAPAFFEALATGLSIPLISAVGPAGDAVAASAPTISQPATTSMPGANVAGKDPREAALASSASEPQLADLSTGLVAKLTAEPLANISAGSLVSLPAEPQLGGLATEAFATVGAVDVAADVQGLLAPTSDVSTAVIASLSADPQLSDVSPGGLASLPADPKLADVATGAFATLGPVDSAADAADDVQNLLGTDPAAGIATLVSLVSVTDVLPVTEAANDAGEKAEDPTADLLEALAAEPVPETNLLGIDAEEPLIPGTVTTPDPPGGTDLPDGLG